MSTGFVNIHGQPIEQFAVHAAPVKPRKEAPAKYHKGWMVEGHPKGACEAARLGAEEGLRAWDRDRVGKAPAPWNEQHWRQNARFTAIRTKPFAVYDAAEQMKSMAMAAGWEDVRIRELAKRA